MKLRLVLALGAVLLGVSAGCSSRPGNVTMPEPRPLGREVETVIAPADPASDPLGGERAPQPTGAIDLRRALALALLRNPDLAAFSWQVREAEAASLQAGLRPNPKLDAELAEFGGGGGRRGIRSTETTLSLAQAFELGDKRAKRVRLADLGRELAGWDYEAARLDILTLTTAAFIEVLAGQERVEIQQELVAVSEIVHENERKRVEVGKAAPLEEMKAKVSLASARVEKRQAERELDTARRRLASAWGSTSAEFGPARGRLDAITQPPKLGQLAAFVSRNPDIARWTAEMARHRAAIALEKSGRIPDVTVRGGVRHFNETDDIAFVVGISVPLPVFDRNQGGILRARYAEARAQREREAAGLRARLAIVEAHQTIESAFAEATSIKNDILPGAEAAFTAASEGYRRGKYAYLDVLDARRTLFESKRQYISALKDYHKAAADLERLIGAGLDSIPPEKAKAQNDE